MATMTKVSTLNRNFVALQFKRDGYNNIHIQGSGPYVNRDYGVAEDVTVPDKVGVWLDDQVEGTMQSLASPKECYSHCQARLDDDESVIFQIPGSEGNRTWGYQFRVDADDVPNVAGLLRNA